MMLMYPRFSIVLLIAVSSLLPQDLVVRLEMLRDRDGHVSSLADSRD
jgi:hypothetical protein